MTNLEKIIEVNKDMFINMLVQSYCIDKKYKIIRGKAVQSFPCSECIMNDASTCQEEMRAWLSKECE